MEINLHEKKPTFLLVRLAFLSHFLKIMLLFQCFHLLNFLLPCAYLLLNRYSINIFPKPQPVLFSFSGCIFYLTPPRSHALY